jgi:hypothetical protein
VATPAPQPPRVRRARRIGLAHRSGRGRDRCDGAVVTVNNWPARTGKRTPGSAARSTVHQARGRHATRWAYAPDCASSRQAGPVRPAATPGAREALTRRRRRGRAARSDTLPRRGRVARAASLASGASTSNSPSGDRLRSGPRQASRMSLRWLVRDPEAGRGPSTAAFPAWPRSAPGGRT